MPRGPHESHGLSTTRCPTSSVVTAGPTSTTSATTSCPNTVGKREVPVQRAVAEVVAEVHEDHLGVGAADAGQAGLGHRPVVTDEPGSLELLHDHGHAGRARPAGGSTRPGGVQLLGPDAVEKTLHADPPTRRRADGGEWPWHDDTVVVRIGGRDDDDQDEDRDPGEPDDDARQRESFAALASRSTGGSASGPRIRRRCPGCRARPRNEDAGAASTTSDRDRPRPLRLLGRRAAP